MSRNKNLFRRIASTVLAVFFALLVPVTVLIAVFSPVFSDVDALAESLVDEAYLDAATQSAEEAFLDVSLLYGVDKEVFSAVLSEQRAEMRVCAVKSIKSLLSSFFKGGKYEICPFDSAPFEEALRAYLNETVTEGTVISEEVTSDLSSDCAAVVTSALAPVGQGMLKDLLESAQGVLPARTTSVLSLAFLGLIVVCLVLLAAVFFLAPKENRYNITSGALFCGACLVFVPAFFLFFGTDFSSVAISEGVLRILVLSLVSRVLTTLRIISVILFVLATVLLGICTVRFAKNKTKEPLVTVPSDTEPDDLSEKQETPLESDGSEEVVLTQEQNQESEGKEEHL